ncbi:DUF1304 domain-containing protein [Leptotrichia buccalis]|uniref:Integral membrane protein n=1 Tax=Leptotrichia buccalis (strain ATCC 14201 / DSM 1135 / JCM 12969 / NCTC 10249 / C-1013-b) TaxID=523794 RepID=C7NDA0_LEPBD|nr:DUF1304 domain-containing protein [Leptotrichia buccalis]ACV39978.1 protein of unknown function DUF1304 [Leptotrichia buccalis C-1013-b]
MSILAFILIIFVAIQHYCILILEMFFNESGAVQKNFGLELEFLKDERVKKMMSNQGLYNGFLASGLMWSLTETGEFQFQIAIFFLICIVCAAIYGSATVSKKIFLLQGIPALLAITSLLLPLLFW